ncbi:unnamed protein product [Dimorphilus gyrociliatus]|uniref:Uncharacterized protein n=1 Tax=Dimorphilus gyrociliatus TaxID=2664684 RepID=A0A7I8VW15_9ANNE|nr:unnamed protein product [Dimorphilus gyrociliatus]
MDKGVHIECLGDLEDDLSTLENGCGIINFNIPDQLGTVSKKTSNEVFDCVSMRIENYPVQVILLTGHKTSKISSKLVSLIPPLNSTCHLLSKGNDEVENKITKVTYKLKFGNGEKDCTFIVEDMDKDDAILGWDILDELGAQFDFGQSVVRLFLDRKCFVLPLMNKKSVPKLTDVLTEKSISLGPEERCIFFFSCPPVPLGTKEVIFDARDEIQGSPGLDALSSVVKISNGKIGILMVNSKWRKITINEGEIIGEIRLLPKKQSPKRSFHSKINLPKYYVKQSEYATDGAKVSVTTSTINELVDSILQDQVEDLQRKRRKLESDRKRLLYEERTLNEKEEKITCFKNAMSNCRLDVHRSEPI